MGLIYRFDDAEIDVEGFRLLKAGKAVPIEPKALNLLVFLVQNPGRMVSRRELIDSVWNGAFVTDHVLNRAIGQLRRLLADDPKEPRYIETVPTLGYRFVATVVAEGTEVPTSLRAPDQGIRRPADRPGSAARDPSPAGQVSPTRRKGLWTIRALAVALVLAVGVAAWVLGIRSHWFASPSIR